MEIPFLNLNADALHYVGEGNENIVFSILNTGGVLRLKKTALIGNIPNREDFINRFVKDLEFIDFSRCLVGPELVDKAYPVSVDPLVIDNVLSNVEWRREEKRLNKRGNPYGLGILFINATATFNIRTLSTISNPLLHHEFPLRSLKTSAAQGVKSLSFDCDAKILISNRCVHEHSTASALETRSILQHVCKPLGASNICLDDPILSLKRSLVVKYSVNIDSQPKEDMHKDGNLTKKRKSAIDRCCHSASLYLGSLQRKLYNITENEALSYRMYNDFGRNFDSLVERKICPSLICVEVKPKQGYKEMTPSGSMICRFCLKQHIKLKKGTERVRSLYCPLDLFSGDPHKMKNALHNLFTTPQNNLRIFSNGAEVPDISNFRFLIDIIIAIILQDFDTEKENLSVALPNVHTNEDSRIIDLKSKRKGTMFQDLSLPRIRKRPRIYRRIFNPSTSSTKLPITSILGRILSLQSISRIYECESAVVMKNATNVFASEREVNDTLTDFGELARSSGHLSTSHPLGEHTNRSERFSVKETNSKLMDTKPHDYNIAYADVMESLKETLLAMSFKDVSLMLLLQGPYDRCSKENIASPFWIESPHEKVWYKCQVTVVDLALKCPNKIQEHEESLEKMEALLEELRKSNSEPPCCSLPV